MTEARPTITVRFATLPDPKQFGAHRVAVEGGLERDIIAQSAVIPFDAYRRPQRRATTPLVRGKAFDQPFSFHSASPDMRPSACSCSTSCTSAATLPGLGFFLASAASLFNRFAGSRRTVRPS